MANSRKDLRGNTLYRGEHQRKSDKRYMYIYTDPIGRRKYIMETDTDKFNLDEEKMIILIKGASHTNDVAKKKYDILIVDESHRLKQRKNLSRYDTYDDACQKKGLPIACKMRGYLYG